MKRIFSAGGLVYRVFQSEAGEPQVKWLIRRAAANPGFKGSLGWSFPKGMIDSGETVEQAAVREVGEEGGVEARAGEKLPTVKIFFKWENDSVMKFITYFVMEYVADIPGGHDWETAETRWVSTEEAMEMLEHKNEKKLLTLAQKGLAEV